MNLKPARRSTKRMWRPGAPHPRAAGSVRSILHIAKQACARRLTRDEQVRVVADVILLNCALLLALALHYLWSINVQDGRGSARTIVSMYVHAYVSSAWPLTVIAIALFALSGFYTHGRAYRGRFKAPMVAQAITVSYLAFGCSSYLSGGLLYLPRTVTPVAWFLSMILLGGARLWAHIWTIIVVAERRVPPRGLDITDLLGRDELHLDVATCAHYLDDRVVLVTGAAGSIGSELCRQLLGLRPRRLVLLDMNESGLFDLDANLRALGARSDLQVCIVDITDEEQINRVFDQYRPQVVFHAAAYKHVPLLEAHPGEAIRVNVFGTAVLCRAAEASGVEHFVFISTDKAVAAVNNLGYSKRIGELLMRAYAQGGTTIFCAVRFGNVIGSRGSVVPTFERQIAAGGPVTVTHPEVTRFFMSISEAACLVIEAAARAASGSIFLLDMGQPVPIVSLAEKMIRLRGLRVGTDIELVFTGLRPGEKLHEDLTCAHEDTVPTAHAKIRGVIDRRPVSRPEMEAMVQSLFLLSHCSDWARASEALRAAAQGEPLPLCAADDGRRPASSLSGVALEPAHDHVGAPGIGASAS